MYYVYIIQRELNDSRYIGFTTDLKSRIRDHNSGKNKHTAKFKPWKLKTYVAFNSQQKAINFEKYLKTGSGTAFRRKRL